MCILCFDQATTILLPPIPSIFRPLFPSSFMFSVCLCYLCFSLDPLSPLSAVGCAWVYVEPATWAWAASRAVSLKKANSPSLSRISCCWRIFVVICCSKFLLFGREVSGNDLGGENILIKLVSKLPIQKVEARGSDIWGHPQLHRKFEASLGYIRFSLKETKTNQTKKTLFWFAFNCCDKSAD